jgi:putative DNA primase/helicase
MSNELPKLGDASTAIVGRFVLLLLTRSWLGKEDRELEGKLHQELSGVLNWSLDGLYRLTIDNENKFTLLASAEDSIVAMRDLASPVAALAREHCVVGPREEVERDDIYRSFKEYCAESEYKKLSKAEFGQHLKAVVPGLHKARPGPREKRRNVYVGIALRPSDDPSDDEPNLL